jgi:hypothetical protein
VPDHELALYFGEITQRVYRRMLWPGSIDYTPPGEPLLLDEEDEDDEEDGDDF